MKLLNRILWFTREYSKNDISAHAAQVSFFVMISFFPFFLFLLTLIQYIPVDEDTLIQVAGSLLPGAISTTLVSWIQEALTKSSGTIASLTILAAIWASSKGFLGIYACLQKIYHVNVRKNFIQIRLLAVFYTISFSLMITISLLVLVYGNQIFLFINRHIPVVGELINSVFPFRSLIGFSIFVLFFIILFTFVPNRKLKMRAQFPGALITSVLWIAFSYLYSIYIDHFSNMTSLYGSLTYAVAFMLWLFFCIHFIFLGAQINVFIAQLKSPDNNTV